MPFPLQHTHLARLHAGRQLELDLAVERLDRQRHAERRLHDRQVDLRVDVVSLADEPRIGLHADEDVHVARRGRRARPRAPRRRRGCAGRRGCRPERRRRARAARASGPRRRIRVHGCSTISPRPWQCGHADVRTNSPNTLRETCCSRPVPLHRSQRDGRRSRLDAVAAAARAGRRRRRTARATVVPRAASTSSIAISAPTSAPRALPAAARAAAEQVVAEERSEQVAEPAHVEVRRREAAGAEPRVPVSVVERPRLRVRQHLVRLGHLAEPRLGVRLLRDVGMQLRARAAGTPS